MRKPKKEIQLTSYDELLGINEAEQNSFNQVFEVPLNELYPFKNHPFHVNDDEKMAETVESIKNYGILNPALVRPRAEGGYELIAGHRRKRGCELAGKSKMPVLIRNYTDDEAVIVMVDSNIQRENLLPSEKAYAYKMKMDAVKHQGIKDENAVSVDSADLVGQAAGDSGRTVQRYIRLTCLIPELLKLLDEGKINFTVGVSLTYLSETEQIWVKDCIVSGASSVTGSMATKLKQYSGEGKLTELAVQLILNEKKTETGKDESISQRNITENRLNRLSMNCLITGRKANNEGRRESKMAKSESTKIEFGYFHDYESEQFAFYRIPKVLFTDEYFRNLSSDAKVLYGLMLDRMALSIRNNWVDNEGKVYIIFTLEQVMEYMNCGKDKGVKILAELDTDKGIGLIERVKRGLGKPTIIYVKSFVYRKEKVLDSAENDNRSQEVGKAEVKSSEKPKSGVLESRSQEFGKTEVWKSEKSKSRVRKNRSTEVGKTDPNNTNYNYTDISNTDRSNTDLINLSDSSEQQSMDLMEEMGLFQMNTALVKRNIEYDCLVQRCRLGEQQQLDEIVALIVETISIERENITISGVKYPYQFVKSRLLLLEESHIEYVLDCLHENTREVKNIKAYLLTCLMNSITTIGNYYQAKVNHDMYGGGI